MHQVIDLNSKSRNVRSVKKIDHFVPDVIEGGEVLEVYVEVVVVGKNREWVEWWPLKSFEKSNPGFTAYE